MSRLSCLAAEERLLRNLTQYVNFMLPIRRWLSKELSWKSLEGNKMYKNAKKATKIKLGESGNRSTIQSLLCT